jgi:hypothetical protein
MKIVSEIFELIMPKLSTHIRELMQAYIRELYKKAKETENIFDDYAIELLASILNIDLEQKVQIVERKTEEDNMKYE